MRTWLLTASLFAAVAVHGDIAFVAPQPGAQAIGPQIIEVTTDAATVDRVEFRVDGVLAGVVRKPPFRLAHDFGTKLSARNVEARVFSNGYRSIETAELITASVSGESMTVDLVEVPVRIRSPRPLKPADLRVREDSIEQRVREIQPVRGSAHFAFVVDRSLSMSDGKLDAAMQAVSHSRTLLRPGDTSSLVVFNHHVTRGDTPANLKPSGGTALRDAVASTIAGRDQRTYIIAITDGGDRNSLLSTNAALERISGTKTVVSAVILGRGSPFLERAANMTGGIVLSARRDNVARQVARIIEDINSRYTLVYQSSGTRSGWRTISLASRTRGVEIASGRTRYFSE